jgi:class 3 adenylate cyclase
LDYFGQTVNIAARVQALADANEICLSQDIYEAPSVADLLRSFVVEPSWPTSEASTREVSVFRVASREAARPYVAGA